MEGKMEHKHKRRIYIVNKKFQFKYLFIILSIMVVTMVSISFTTFYVIWNNVIEEFFYIPDASKKLAEIFNETSVMLIIPIVALAVLGIFAGVMLSHRIAGPIYRVEKVSEELAKGNFDIKVRFRKGDDLQELAGKLNEMIDSVRGMISGDKALAEEIHVLAKELQSDLKKQKGLKKDVELAVKKLNTMAAKLKKSTERYKV